MHQVTPKKEEHVLDAEHTIIVMVGIHLLETEVMEKVLETGANIVK